MEFRLETHHLFPLDGSIDYSKRNYNPSHNVLSIIPRVSYIILVHRLFICKVTSSDLSKSLSTNFFNVNTDIFKHLSSMSSLTFFLRTCPCHHNIFVPLFNLCSLIAHPYLSIKLYPLFNNEL